MRFLIWPGNAVVCLHGQYAVSQVLAALTMQKHARGCFLGSNTAPFNSVGPQAAHYAVFTSFWSGRSPTCKSSALARRREFCIIRRAAPATVLAKQPLLLLPCCSEGANSKTQPHTNRCLLVAVSPLTAPGAGAKFAVKTRNRK